MVKAKCVDDEEDDGYLLGGNSMHAASKFFSLFTYMNFEINADGWDSHSYFNRI